MHIRSTRTARGTRDERFWVERLSHHATGQTLNRCWNLPPMCNWFLRPRAAVYSNLLRSWWYCTVHDSDGGRSWLRSLHTVNLLTATYPGWDLSVIASDHHTQARTPPLQIVYFNQSDFDIVLLIICPLSGPAWPRSMSWTTSARWRQKKIAFMCWETVYLSCNCSDPLDDHLDN